MPVNLSTAARSFFEARRIAVAGASRTPASPGHAILLKLRALGYEAIPVNPAASTLAGVPCYPDLASVPGGVEAVVVATPPQATEQVVRECHRLGIGKVWIHRALGPGSASAAAVEFCREHGIAVIAGACPLMFCRAADLPHRCMRGILGLFGQLPKPEGEWS
ncbi:MAG TPA: CoA-binding protein [Candidatus Saccharimonadales bacterium]|nr:CoA-binding protein [Candidatus Saccharimonadales bacterium]